MKYAIVDYRISEEELISLENLNISPILCPKSTTVYDAINGHPDIQINILNEKELILNKDIDLNFSKKLLALGFNVHFTHSSLSDKYPYNIILNAVNLGNYFIHKLDCTDKNLLNLNNKKILINTRQGYTKCSTAIVSDNAIITSDKSIIKSIKDTSIDYLYISPGNILLPGLNYGFIGGCCGLLDKNTLAFFGDLSYHPDCKIIIEFLNKHNIKPIYLKKGPLIDRGSLFIINI